MEPPKVVPKKVKEWHTEQPEHEILPSIPARMALLGPSGSGKTQLIQAMCCDFFRRRGRSVFARIYIWSPSVLVDAVWEPVIKMCETELGQDNDREQFLFQSYRPDDLQRVIQTQKEVISRAKEAKLKTLFNILIIVDDFADRPDFTRAETLVWELFFQRPSRQDQHAHLDAEVEGNFAGHSIASDGPLRVSASLPDGARRVLRGGVGAYR